MSILQLAELANALINGDDNVIERMVLNKLRSLGADLIANVIPGAKRVERAVETLGTSEFNRLRSQWLNPLLNPLPQMPGQGAARRINAMMERIHRDVTRPEGRWLDWSRSRQEWLDQSWKHDWRSQPRDWHGRWTRGRLRHPYVSKGARRIRRARRRQGRMIAREIAKRIVDER